MELLTYLGLALAAISIGLLLVVLSRLRSQSVRDELALARREAQDAARQARDELALRLEAIRAQIASDAQMVRRDLAANLIDLRQQLDQIRGQVASDAKASRAETALSLSDLRQQLESIRSTVERQLGALQADNSAKLEQMRATVEEKLEGTLERRLGSSFKQVSDRLDQVHKGLGEMQTLAVGVGDLKRVMANVKTRGIWGEIQLGSLLEQILAPEQYAANVQTKKASSGRVEFALKMPGRDGQDSGFIWLPIDAKFPLDRYTQLVEAQERADIPGCDLALRQLESFIVLAAKEIGDKYVAPPETTDFAVMYLPTEGLFAEVARRPALVEKIQREHRIVIAGPTTLAALLNSLQMGFRTLAVQKRSSEVWNLLGAVKAEFTTFGHVLDKVHKKLGEAGETIAKAQTRTRVIGKKLKAVEAHVPSAKENSLLALEGASREFDDDQAQL